MVERYVSPDGSRCLSHAIVAFLTRARNIQGRLGRSSTSQGFAAMKGSDPAPDALAFRIIEVPFEVEPGGVIVAVTSSRTDMLSGEMSLA